MFDFNKYDDAMEVKNYDGFIDRDGNFYKVGLRIKKDGNDSHNSWAETYIREKLNFKDVKLNVTNSTIFTLVSLSGPAEILINCFGYVYYSHDPIFYKPIIKIPNPKIANYKVTEEQLNMLYMIMAYNRENTDISILNGDDNVYDYCGLDDDEHYHVI